MTTATKRYFAIGFTLLLVWTFYNIFKQSHTNTEIYVLKDSKYISDQAYRTEENKRLKSDEKATENLALVKHIHYYKKPEFIKPNVFRNCKFKCKMTWGPSEYNKSDAVIFFSPRIGNKTEPPRKPPGQIWILHSKESTANYYSFRSEWRNVFNWTMTFRRDSDIVAMNGIFSKRTTFPKNVERNLFSWKPKLVAWFASNCETPGKREKLVSNLLKMSENVDIYGVCGKFKCPRGNRCMDILRNKYKFYLSMENSLCYDYITEKAFKVYENLPDVIPIVRGVGPQYPMYLPPNSYIDAEKFKSTVELLKFIENVNANKTLFKSFFKWKKYYESYWSYPVEFCELCRKVHQADKYKRIITDVRNWLNLTDYKEICRAPSDVD